MDKKFASFSKKRKYGYALGIFTDSLLYNMFYTYFLTFLVQIAGIKPAVAGIVIFVSICWDAITDPLIGAYTDRDGIDKRKVMSKSIVPLAIVFMLSWLNWGAIIHTASPVALTVIYIILTMSIWLFYTLFTIPYYAVVAEITEDYDERTAIRGLSATFNGVAVAIGNVLPALVSTVILGHAVSYFDVSVVMSLMAIALGFISVAALKGLYLAKAEKEPIKVKKTAAFTDTFNGFKEIVKLPPFKFFMLFVFFFLFGASMIQSSFTYSVVYCMDLPYDDGIVIVVASLVVVMIIMSIVSEKVAQKLDRKTTCIIFVSITCVLLVVLKITGLNIRIGDFNIMAVALPAVCSIGLGTFWSLFYSMGYDFVEIDEYVHGERRESLITAFPQFIQKLGSGAGILVQGLLLTAIGYEKSADEYSNMFSEITDVSIIKGMESITTIIPAGLFVISIIGLILLTTTRERMEKLTTKLEQKRAGETVSDEGIEILLPKK